MSTATLALIWEIWQKKKTAILSVGGMTTLGLLNLMLPPTLRTAFWGNDNPAAGMVNWMLFMTSILLLFVIFSYDEFLGEQGATGFPHRLFTLPVSTFRLVALPMILGVAGIELTFGLWVGLIVPWEGNFVAGAVLFGSYMVAYQLGIWTLGRLGALRLAVLALIAFVYFGVGLEVGFMDSFFTERSVILIFVPLSLLMFSVAWIAISHQRSRGSRSEKVSIFFDKSRVWIAALIGGAALYRVLHDSPRRATFVFIYLPIFIWSGITVLRASQSWLSERINLRRKPFRSPITAQFWFEWRRSGMVLPVLLGVLLLVVVLPLSLSASHQTSSTLWILAWTLAMPAVLAFLVGKIFSKPDFWSDDLSFPAALAVKPIAEIDIIRAKLRVAALSTALASLLTWTFVGVWLSSWAEPSALRVVHLWIGSISGTNRFSQIAFVILFAICGALLIWRSLVSTLWLGLAGQKVIFGVSAFAYPFILLFGVAGLRLGAGHLASVVTWIQHDLVNLLRAFVWLLALLVVLKGVTAGYAWRHIERRRLVTHLISWVIRASAFIALALVLSPLLARLATTGSNDLRNISVLVAVLLTPFARFGTAALLFARNRHR